MINSIGRKAIQAFDELGQAPAPRRVIPQEVDLGPSFPYGSEWWMGYTISADNSQVLVHNVGLHYNRGFVSGGTTPFTFAVGVGETITMGFKVSFADGTFTQLTGEANLIGPSTYSDLNFVFPVYKFTRGAQTTDAPVMSIDYVHGSNIGW